MELCWIAQKSHFEVKRDDEESDYNTANYGPIGPEIALSDLKSIRLPF